MLNIVHWLLDWPRNSKGEVIFKNSHEAIFYAIMVRTANDFIKELEALRIKAKWDLNIEKMKPDGNPDLMIQLASKHQFYSECIETTQKLFRE